METRSMNQSNATQHTGRKRLRRRIHVLTEEVPSDDRHEIKRMPAGVSHRRAWIRIAAVDESATGKSDKIIDEKGRNTSGGVLQSFRALIHEERNKATHAVSPLGKGAYAIPRSMPNKPPKNIFNRTSTQALPDGAPLPGPMATTGSARPTAFHRRTTEEAMMLPMSAPPATSDGK